MKPFDVDNLVSLVRRMRLAQRRLAASPGERQYQSEARDLERRVDRLLEGVRQPTLFEAAAEGGAA